MQPVSALDNKILPSEKWGAYCPIQQSNYTSTVFIIPTYIVCVCMAFGKLVFQFTREHGASTDGSVHMSLYSSATQTSTSFFSRIQIEGGSGMTCRIKGAHIVTHSSPVQSVDSHNCHINLRLLICTDNAEQHTGTLLTTVVCRGVLPRHLFFLRKLPRHF